MTTVSTDGHGHAPPEGKLTPNDIQAIRSGLVIPPFRGGKGKSKQEDAQDTHESTREAPTLPPSPPSEARTRARQSVAVAPHTEAPRNRDDVNSWDLNGPGPYPDAYQPRTLRQGNRPLFGPYILLQTLGEGEFGKVKLGVHENRWNEEVAIKLIRKGHVDTVQRSTKVRREIEVLKMVRHPNIVRLKDVIETEKVIGIVLEFASGGELFDHILANEHLDDVDASRLFAQLISGVAYLHQKNIVHRDLKLENLLLDKHRNIIITDFGFANRFTQGNSLMLTSCGSPCYAAPELVVQNGKYVGTAVDVWSCGVILYAMLAGYLPFDDDPDNPESENIHKLYQHIMTTPLTFPKHVSPVARDLLRHILVPDPQYRYTLVNIMSHPFLAHHIDSFRVTVGDLERKAVEEERQKAHAVEMQRLFLMRQAQYREQMLHSSNVRTPANVNNAPESGRASPRRQHRSSIAVPPSIQRTPALSSSPSPSESSTAGDSPYMNVVYPNSQFASTPSLAVPHAHDMEHSFSSPGDVDLQQDIPEESMAQIVNRNTNTLAVPHPSRGPRSASPAVSLPSSLVLESAEENEQSELAEAAETAFLVEKKIHKDQGGEAPESSPALSQTSFGGGHPSSERFPVEGTRPRTPDPSSPVAFPQEETPRQHRPTTPVPTARPESSMRVVENRNPFTNGKYEKVAARSSSVRKSQQQTQPDKRESRMSFDASSQPPARRTSIFAKFLPGEEKKRPTSTVLMETPPTPPSISHVSPQRPSSTRQRPAFIARKERPSSIAVPPTATERAGTSQALNAPTSRTRRTSLFSVVSPTTPTPTQTQASPTISTGSTFENVESSRPSSRASRASVDPTRTPSVFNRKRLSDWLGRFKSDTSSRSKRDSAIKSPVESGRVSQTVQRFEQNANPVQDDDVSPAPTLHIRRPSTRQSTRSASRASVHVPDISTSSSRSTSGNHSGLYETSATTNASSVEPSDVSLAFKNMHLADENTRIKNSRRVSLAGPPVIPMKSSAVSSVTSKSRVLSERSNTLSPNPNTKPHDALRFHHGAIDKAATSSRAPEALINDIRVVLWELGIQIEPESDYRFKCTRRSHPSTPKNPDSLSRMLRLKNNDDVLPSSVYGDLGNDVIKFAIELQRLRNFDDLLFVDMRRIKGSVWGYKILHDQIFGRLDL